MNSTLVPSAIGQMGHTLRSLSAGRAVILVDDENPQDEGDLVLAAGAASTHWVSFFVLHTCGFLRVALSGADCDRLWLAPMHYPNTETSGADYRVTVDVSHGIGTGISARDRACTIRALADPVSTPHDFTRPGHVVPVRYQNGGELRQREHAEAAAYLVQLAGLRPVALLAQVVSAEEDGITMARLPELQRFAGRHGLDLVTITDLISLRLRIATEDIGCAYVSP